MATVEDELPDNQCTDSGHVHHHTPALGDTLDGRLKRELELAHSSRSMRPVAGRPFHGFHDEHPERRADGGRAGGLKYVRIAWVFVVREVTAVQGLGYAGQWIIPFFVFARSSALM